MLEQQQQQRHDSARRGRTSSSEQEASKAMDAKTLRRLAQNREAARKSRLRKKAYVQQLESSRIKLNQLEQHLQQARAQGFLIGSGLTGDAASHSAGAAAFEMEYARWVDDQRRIMCELGAAYHTHMSDNELRVLVDNCLAHFDEKFRLKNVAAKTDVFHVLSGMWKTPAERCYMWMGGFRPSDLIKILVPQLEPFTDHQLMGIYNLQHSSQQAEEALSQGMENLQQSLTQTIVGASLLNAPVDYMSQMAVAVDKLTNLEAFVRQADNLRQETLHQLHRILTTRQMARCFLAIGEYFNRLRALSFLFSDRQRQ